MSLVSRLKVGLALVIFLSAVTAFVGIQRIVHVTNETAKFDARTETAKMGLGLVRLMDKIEESNYERSTLLTHFKEEAVSFITGLRTIEAESANSKEVLTLEPTKLEDRINQWQTDMRPQPRTEKNWFILKSPVLRSDGKTQILIHETVAILVADVGTRIRLLRDESAGTIRLLALAALAIVLAGLFLMLRLQRQLEDPLDRLEEVLDEALREHLVRRTGIRSDNEFGRIGRKLDRVLTRLEMARLDNPPSKATEAPQARVPATPEDSQPADSQPADEESA